MDSELTTYSILRSNRELGLKHLFERYSKKLLKYAIYKWQLEEDLAWDLIYKCIYKTADVIHQYEFPTEQKFASFLFKIFMNAIRDQLKNKRSFNNTIVPLRADDASIHSHIPEPSDQPKEHTAMIILQQELDALEDWQRILVLMRSQEIPYSEIAKYVDKPEDQLKTYYARLKKMLMEKINKRLTMHIRKENV